MNNYRWCKDCKKFTIWIVSSALINGWLEGIEVRTPDRTQVRLIKVWKCRQCGYSIMKEEN